MHNAWLIAVYTSTQHIPLQFQDTLFVKIHHIDYLCWHSSKQECRHYIIKICFIQKIVIKYMDSVLQPSTRL